MPMRHVARSAVLLTATVLLPRAPRAQEPPTARDTTTLRAVVVTATRLPVEASLAPASVTLIAGDDLTARGIRTVADALAGVPGLAVVRSGSFGATTSVFARGGNSNYVKVLVDGVAVNNPGGSFDFATLTTDNVERIEIVRGPASVVYGSDAVAGVIQIFTRRGSGRMTGSAEVRAGSYGTIEASADARGGGTSTAYSIGAAARETDGTLPFNNGYRSHVGSARLGLAPWRAGAIDLTARHTDGTYHFPTDGAGRVVDSNAVRRDARTVVGLDASHRVTPRLALRLLAGASYFDGGSTNEPDSPGDTAGFYGRDDARIERRAGELRADLHAPGGAVLSLGTELLRQQIRSTSSSRFMQFPPLESSFRAHRTNLAYYAQAIGPAGPALSYTASARLDDNGVFGTFATARASLAWRVGSGTTLRAAAGNAFKEPAFEETFSSAFTLGNPELEPERTLSWEVSAERRFAAGRAHVAATWFDQRFRDLIQYVAGDVRGTNQNLAAATARGLELEAHMAPVDRVSVGASLTALRTRATDAGNGAFGTFVAGQRLLRRPARSATAHVSYRAAASAWLGASVRYVGERDDHDFERGERVVLPAYAAVDLSAEVSLEPLAPALARAMLTARVENALDRRYEPVLDFPAPGRTVLVGVRVRGGE